MLDLDDVQVGALAQEGFDFLLQGFHACAALADDDAGLGGVNGDVNLGAGALDVNAGNAGHGELFLQHLAEIVILDEVVGEILLASVPFGAPVQNDTYACAVGINFLTHFLSSLTSGQAQW